MKTASSLKSIGSHIVRLAPAWVPNFCHVVRDYDAVLEIIDEAGIPDCDLLHAFDNAERAGVIIPPYLQDAMQSVRSRCE